MQPSRRYIVDFHTIDWDKVLNNRTVDCRNYYTYSATKGSKDHLEFKRLYDAKYFEADSGYGLSYETYKRLIATAMALGL